MQVLSDKLESIELKLRQLAIKIESLKSENASLLDENKKLRASLSEKSNAVGLLEDRLEQNSQQHVEMPRDNELKNSKKLKKDIERYIKEIDKCIE